MNTTTAACAGRDATVIHIAKYLPARPGAAAWEREARALIGRANAAISPALALALLDQAWDVVVDAQFGAAAVLQSDLDGIGCLIAGAKARRGAEIDGRLSK